MRRQYYSFGIAALVLFAMFAIGRLSFAQDDRHQQPATNSETGRGYYRGVGTAERFDISPPLRTLRNTTTKEERERDEFEDRPTGLEGPLGPQDMDLSVQSTTSPFAPLVMPTPIVSFDSTASCGGCAPPDPVGDVGPNNYVAMANAQFQVFNKSGTSLLGPSNINTLWSGFGGACQTENAGDPVVIYDQLDNRWILTQFTAAGPTYYNCVAVSTTGDPTGSYYRYAFTTGTNFPDYPKYGMWGDALYISTREFAGSTFAGVGAYAVNRSQLIAGNPAAQVISFLATPTSAGGMFNVGDGLLPSDLDGSTLPPANSPNFFIGSMDNGGPYSATQDALTIWKFTANFAVPASSSFVLANTVPIASYDTIPAFCSGRACISQPSTTNKIDHLGYRQRPLHRAAYRNFGDHEAIVTNQSVEASTTMSGIRWWEIRSPNSSPTIFQEGTYAPGTSDLIHRWMGSIAMDKDGNMALGYSAASSTVFPSVRYTGRLVGDTLGTMPQGEASIIAGTGSQTGGGNRWGDYSSMNIDSTDDCTFWYVSEYVPTTSAAGWRLRIGSFKFPSCSAGATPTATSTFTPTPTSTNTNTPTPTSTNTFTPTATSTNTFTPTPTATNTFTPTATSTNTFTPTPTATNTFTPTATSTNTFTPTPTATETFTPTATNTATDTPTATATETFTPTPQAVISGIVTYGNAVGSPAPPRFVSGVQVSAVGSPNLSDTTGSLGTYSLTGFGGGSYTITPSKSGGDNNSISSFDAAKLSQHVIGGPQLNAAQLIVADVSGTSGVSSFDAALIARYVATLGPPFGNTGTWIFNPVNYTHPSVTTSITDDYSALLMGEVSGNWTNSGPRPFDRSPSKKNAVAITAPTIASPVNGEIMIPVTIQGAAGKGIISYEFDLRYDPAVIQPAAEPVDLTDTASRGLFDVVNRSEEGLLRVVMYGPIPIDGNGLLIKLRFVGVGAQGSASSLVWERLLLNDGELPTFVTDGRIELSSETAAGN